MPDTKGKKTREDLVKTAEEGLDALAILARMYIREHVYLGDKTHNIVIYSLYIPAPTLEGNNWLSVHINRAPHPITIPLETLLYHSKNKK